MSSVYILSAHIRCVHNHCEPNLCTVMDTHNVYISCKHLVHFCDVYR